MHGVTPPPGNILQTDIRDLPGVGPTRAAELRQRGVNDLLDLLEYFPRAYQFERAERPISDLVDEQLQIARGQVTAVDYVVGRSKPRFEASLDDGTGNLALLWFHGGYLRRLIHPGLVLRVQGKVRYRGSIPQMANPRWEKIEPDAALVGQDRLRAVYPASKRLSSLYLGKLIEQQLDAACAALPEWFDPQTLARRQLVARAQAYRWIHRPSKMTEAAAARRRLVYDELMLLQLGLILSKRFRAGRLTAPAMRLDSLLDQRIRRRFGFELTTAQHRAVCEIARDLQSTRPMNRLLQGDVGSGKTVVALYAMLVAVANRMQAAILAPTEVLAEQHYLTLGNFLRDSQVRIELLTGRTRRRTRGTSASSLSSGQAHIAIGTQALLQQQVEFANLGLVVVDEQHKLGVRQRATLKGKGMLPHYLVMTATPIPRTLALSYFADFDVSIIDQLPPGRHPIQTRWLPTRQADQAFAFVRQQVAQGRQAYVVVPQIEDDGLEEVKSLTSEYQRLKDGPLHGLRLGMLHGQMPTEEKQRLMADFRAGNVDVLVATTVIEVGIDVPNATVMVIQNAERFGLSQLHQLRGRVGRSELISHCLLIGDAPTDDAQKRLATMTATGDGFQIAEMDLKLRGPGEFFGVRQHGLPELKLADITRELELLHQAKEDALALLADDPNLSHPAHQALRAALIDKFGDDLPLAQVG
jgi:ATP-dependent DNA helicase RecG